MRVASTMPFIWGISISVSTRVEARAVGRIDHQAFQAVAGLKYVVTLVLQKHRHKLPEGFFVFNYQHRSHNRFSGP